MVCYHTPVAPPFAAGKPKNHYIGLIDPEKLMSNGVLILAPGDPASRLPTREQLVHALGDIGLLGAPLAGQDDTYLAGERFLQLITFMGCSPHVRLEPPVDGADAFCHLALLGPYDRPRLLHGRNTRPPRCPRCKTAITNWREFVDADTITCSHCGATCSMAQLEWRRNAGYGRLFIEIRNIFPGEAVPVDELMNRLRETGGGEWGYFYLQK